MDHDPGARDTGAENQKAKARAAERARYGMGLPDHHDPTGGIGGATPAYSALTLRLVLASFGLLFCGVATGWLYAVDGPVWLILLTGLLAAVAAVDLAVVVRRKRRGEPG